MPRIEEYKKTINWLAWLISIMLILLIAGTIHTFTSFDKRAEQVRSDYRDMQERLDDMITEVRGMNDGN